MSKQDPRTYSTAEACRITGVDAAKLNENIHNGNYGVDIELDGRVRVFDERRLVPLWVFGWRLRSGDTPKAAGVYANAIAPLIDGLYSTSAYWRRNISDGHRKSNLLLVFGDRGGAEGGFACDRQKFDLGDERIIEYREISLASIQAIIREGMAAEDKRQEELSKPPTIQLHKSR